MFCSNCGKEMADGMHFCPECRTPTGGIVGASVQAFGQPKVQGKGIYAETDFETLRQMVEKGNRSKKGWKTIGKVLALLYLLLMVRGFINGVESVLNGNAGIWYVVSGMSAMVLVACGLVYVFLEIVLPVVQVKKAYYAEEYLKLIHVENNRDLLKALEQLKCSAIKKAYMDENGKVCLQGRKSKHTFETREGVIVLISEKDNYKTALERETIAGSLLKFLASDAPVNAYEKERNNAKLSGMNKILAIVALISGVIVIFGVVNPDLMDGQRKYIRMVTEAAPQSYPDITYGEVFETFFGDCSWTYFKSEDGQDVVEFHGSCYYDGEEAEVTMQFLVSYEEGKWQLYTITINDEPQPEFIQMLMLEKIFESYEMGDESQNLQIEDSNNTDNDMDMGENGVDSITGDDMTEQGTMEHTREEQDTTDYMLGILFPILSQGYTENSLCPVMVTLENENGDDIVSGTYEEMIASCINDGITMYAAPVMYNGSIITATKWDAPDEMWYDGLLTYDQFLSEVDWICRTYTESGAQSIYTSGSWDIMNALAGKWSDGMHNISISIFSDASFYNAYDEIGTFNMEETGVSGTVTLLGTSDESLYVLCNMADGDKMELRYTSDGMLEVEIASEAYGIGENTYLTCIERFES